MSVNYFPDTQTLTMQREALKRVREMQQRAQQSVAQSNDFSEPYISQIPIGPQPSRPTMQPPSQAQPPPHTGTTFVPQPPFQQPPQQGPFGRPPQQTIPPQNVPQQNNASHNPQAQNIPQQQNNTQQGQRSPGFSSPNNILSHLFGGGRQSGSQTQGNTFFGGGQRGSAQGSASRSGGSGLLDLLRRQGLGDSVSGLGETLQNTISSVSEPISGILDSFGIDGEKLIILLVMWAIFNEHKDNKTLLMALGYLLL